MPGAIANPFANLLNLLYFARSFENQYVAAHLLPDCRGAIAGRRGAQTLRCPAGAPDVTRDSHFPPLGVHCRARRVCKSAWTGRLVGLCTAR